MLGLGSGVDVKPKSVSGRAAVGAFVNARVRVRIMIRVRGLRSGFGVWGSCSD